MGDGFCGLAAASALNRTKAQVNLIDCANQVFQPLLNAEQIASPIREILGEQRNADVFLAEVTGVDKDR